MHHQAITGSSPPRFAGQSPACDRTFVYHELGMPTSDVADTNEHSAMPDRYRSLVPCNLRQLEATGLEPTTFALRTRRSPKLSYAPKVYATIA